MLRRMSSFRRISQWFQPEPENVVLNWIRGANVVFGPVTRRYLDSFEKYSGDGKHITEKQLMKAMNEIGFFPTKSQVYCMLYTAAECCPRDNTDYITFGEFCIFASELEQQYVRPSILPSLTSPSHSRYRPIPPSPSKKQSSSVISNFNVFLGGSCNPTTWRRDVAIPLLKEYSLTYYNPQVESWSPDLIEIEDKAKRLADLLLFVIDNSTRSIASMVEASFLAGAQRPLILVLKGLPSVVENERLTEKELADMGTAHAFLCDLVERQCLPIFDDLETALHCTAKVLNQGVSIPELGLSDGAQPVKYPDVRIGLRLINLKETFRTYDLQKTGHIALTDALLAMRSLTQKDLSFPAYDQIVRSCSKSGDKPEFDYNEFCCLVTEYLFYQPARSGLSKFFQSTYRFFRQFGRSDAEEEEEVEVQRDVFLGGSCRDSHWREKIVIPILRNNGMTYFNPVVPNWNLRYLPLEAQAKDNCNYLFFVINNLSRSSASMVEVAHYIGQDRNVILCIQDLEDGVVINGEELTPRAVKDYNRGRQYLADVASRERVPIFNDVEEATHALVERIRRDQEKVMRENPSPSHRACYVPSAPQNPAEPRSPMSSCLGL
ncbi:uncharacterized protein LOC121428834 isoform X2 [Lytechinus variegatus]|uniref:uncharacterized protein LOC121428834 isoform X2 n=1 Tax=Lytechinus variegatus TaxID=7654 RepID=UPI001BB2699E|nr:uncharacterized protein LOC121428834 isoform X2 [Lytechinus variegatus]